MFYNAKKISEISEVERMSAIISGRIMADAEYKSTYISFLSLGSIISNYNFIIYFIFKILKKTFFSICHKITNVSYSG